MSDNQGLRDGPAGAELELPSVQAAKRDERRKTALGPLASRAPGLARVLGLFSSPLGRVLPMLMTFGILGVNTLTMNARNAALAAKAHANSSATHVSEPLPSDLVVQKMRATANLDNEALVAAKNGKYDMHFGDYDPAAIQQQKDAEAAAKAAAAKPGAKPAGASKAPPPPDMSKLLAGIPGAGGAGAGAGAGSGFGSSSFGSGFGNNSMGAPGFNNSLNPFGNSIQSSAVRNAAQQGKPVSTAAGARGKSTAMAGGQNVALGAAARGRGAGKLNAMGQLNAAASLSKSAKGMANYQASNVTAAHAFDGSTSGGSIGGLGAGGGAVGVGGAGLGTADPSATPSANSGNSGGGGAGVPGLQTPTGTPDQSCNGGSPVMSQSDFTSAGGTASQYSTVQTECANQQTMKNDMLWMMACGALLMVISMMASAGKTPWTAWMQIAALVMGAAVIAIATKIIIDMIGIIGQTPAMKTQAIITLIGATICIGAAVVAMVGAYQGLNLDDAASAAPSQNQAMAATSLADSGSMASTAGMVGGIAAGASSLIGGMVGGGSPAAAAGGGGGAGAGGGGGGASGGGGGGSGNSGSSGSSSGAGGIKTAGPTIGTAGGGSGGTTQVGAKL